ncbi:DNA-binding response regulator [Psychroflexus sp. MBR-150]|jgi:DNA-binding NarL/FixJ family response regulator
MQYHTLIIDDHPTQVKTYKDIFNLVEDNLTLKFDAFYNLEDAYQFVKHNDTAQRIDLVLLDLNLPPCPKRNLSNGADLAEIIRQDLPQAKLCFLTSHHEAFILYDIYSSYQPQGILVKSDFNGQDLEYFFKAILQDKTFYTSTFKKAHQKIISSEVFMESYNRQILTKLAEGHPSKDLPDILGMSLSAINKRKAKIKTYFGLDNLQDNYLILKARELGLL